MAGVQARGPPTWNEVCRKVSAGSSAGVMVPTAPSLCAHRDHAGGHSCRESTRPDQRHAQTYAETYVWARLDASGHARTHCAHAHAHVRTHKRLLGPLLPLPPGTSELEVALCTEPSPCLMWAQTSPVCPATPRPPVLGTRMRPPLLFGSSQRPYKQHVQPHGELQRKHRPPRSAKAPSRPFSLSSRTPQRIESVPAPNPTQPSALAF